MGTVIIVEPILSSIYHFTQKKKNPCPKKISNLCSVISFE